MEFTTEMARALAKFQAACPKITYNAEASIPVTRKDGSKYTLKYGYAELAHIIETIRPAMKEAGLAHTSNMVEQDLHMYLICEEDGTCLQSSIKVPQVADPKQLASMLTYYRRYLLVGLLGIAAQEDKDMPEGGEEAPKAKRGKAKPPMTEKLYKQALARKAEGEDGILEKAQEIFTLTKEQIDGLS